MESEGSRKENPEVDQWNSYHLQISACKLQRKYPDVLWVGGKTFLGTLCVWLTDATILNAAIREELFGVDWTLIKMENSKALVSGIDGIDGTWRMMFVYSYRSFIRRISSKYLERNVPGQIDRVKHRCNHGTTVLSDSWEYKFFRWRFLIERGNYSCH